MEIKPIINRYELITIIIKELKLSENDREYLARMEDSSLLQHLPYKQLKKGFYY